MLVHVAAQHAYGAFLDPLAITATCASTSALMPAAITIAATCVISTARSPTTWHSELTLHVMCQTTTVRRMTPQTSRLNPNCTPAARTRHSPHGSVKHSRASTPPPPPIREVGAVAWLLPVAERTRFEVTAAAMGKTLRRLLAGRLLGMAVEGVTTWILLAVWGVPLAGVLGLLTGLLAFLPNIGAPISGTLMVLVGFSDSTNTGLFCMVVYLVVQTVDGNIIVPMVAKRTADLAPALVLGMQLIMEIGRAHV